MATIPRSRVAACLGLLFQPVGQAGSPHFFHSASHRARGPAEPGAT
jgi:hypothetical protein